MRKKRVLLLSEGFGAGHTKAAHALSAGLRQSCADIRTRVMELGAFQHPTIFPLLCTAYRKTLTAQPRLYGYVYRSQYQKTPGRVARLALHRLLYAHTANIVGQLQPDVIVCTHPFPNIVVSRLKRAGLRVPLCTVITDYDVHGTWLNPEVDKYLVSTDAVKQKMISFGLSPARIDVTGIPVHPDFARAHDGFAVRAEFGLRELPTVMIMGGGWGLLGDEDGVMPQIAGWADKLQLVFCLGSNAKTLARLQADPRFRHPNIRLLGFTDKIDRLMDVSDLLITKPGGMTCSEGLAKAIPMLFYRPLPGQEEENMHYFASRGFGEPIVSPQTIDSRFALLLQSGDEMRLRRKSLQGGAGASSSALGTQAILHLLGEAGLGEAAFAR